MIGTTLTEIRTHIESLATQDGEYYLTCARYGDRPVPASTLRFPTRATARAAAQATTQYRQALRQYDPQVPYYDVIVCQAISMKYRRKRVERNSFSSPTYSASLSEPVVTHSSTVGHDLVEFCHRVAAAVFETISEHGCDSIESAIMNRYFKHAEELSDPDGLCIRLLESMAVELTDHLEPSEQLTFLSAAADRLEITSDDMTGSTTQSSTKHSVDRLLSILEEIGLFRQATQITDIELINKQSKKLVVEVSEYTLRLYDGRLPLLPIALTLYRCDNEWVPIRMNQFDDGWQIVFCPISEPETLRQAAEVFAPKVN